MTDIAQAFDQFVRDQKARDEGLRRAFGLLHDAMIRMQTVLEALHEAATKEPPHSKIPGLLDDIRILLEAQPEQIAEAVRRVLDSRV